MSEIDTLRERVGGYITALMVDASSVASCEKAMDEAFDALAARVQELEAARERAERLLAVPFGPDSQWENEAREVLAVLVSQEPTT